MKINLLLILLALFCTYFVVLYTSDEEYLQILIGKYLPIAQLKNRKTSYKWHKKHRIICLQD